MRINIKLILTTALLCTTASAGMANDYSAALNMPQHVGAPLERHATDFRAFQGISSLAVAPGGRLWATWYAGKVRGEGPHNYVVLSTSADDGATWEELLVVDPDDEGPLRTFDPEVWVDPLGRLWLIWAQAVSHGHNAHTWTVIAEDANAANPKWSEPRLLAQGVMMCKPTVLSDGTWAFPICDWEARVNKTPDGATAGLWESKDNGATFTLRGAALVPVEHRTFDEHMLVERRDGSIWNLIRTRYGIGESISTDGGKTWPVVTQSAIAHPSARFFIRRLQSGNLLLVKHGAIAKKTGRSHLTAFISKDDGKSWNDGLLLDERTGVSYPDGQQTKDGTIYITYDYSRTGDRTILFAAFREEDVLAGKDVSGKVRLNQLISKASGGITSQKPQGKPKPVLNNADGAKLDTTNPGRWKCTTHREFKLGKQIFSDRGYTLTEAPEALAKVQMVIVAMEGDKTLECEKAGMLYMLTPLRERNKDSASEALIKQGFQKVALPEIRMFSIGNTGNYCTLYQKRCVVGENITFGKWAVPLFIKK
jgi:hypothetical protein